MGIAIWTARSFPRRFASREDAVDETVRSDAGDWKSAGDRPIGGICVSRDGGGGGDC